MMLSFDRTICKKSHKLGGDDDRHDGSTDRVLDHPVCHCQSLLCDLCTIQHVVVVVVALDGTCEWETRLG